MAEPVRRTVDLTPEQDAFVEAKVASGEYADASDVFREGLERLRENDSATERWLRTEVAEAYDRMEADPSRGVPAKQVFAELRTRNAARRAAE